MLIVTLLMMTSVARAQMNNPYVDDKLIHFGFSLGTNLMAYSVTDSEQEIDGEIYHARVSQVLPGFNVGFICDLRMSRHLNLRFIPTLYFGQKTITYKTSSGAPVKGSAGKNAELLSLPLALPLMIKWSAEREKNYRPYLIAGGGVSFDFGRQKDRVIYQQMMDYFVSFGFGCDFYFRWFKFCPEIRYQIGFKNAITPVSERPELPAGDHFYTNALDRLRNQMLVITFNFE